MPICAGNLRALGDMPRAVLLNDCSEFIAYRHIRPPHRLYLLMAALCSNCEAYRVRRPRCPSGSPPSGTYSDAAMLSSKLSFDLLARGACRRRQRQGPEGRHAGAGRYRSLSPGEVLIARRDTGWAQRGVAGTRRIRNLLLRPLRARRRTHRRQRRTSRPVLRRPRSGGRSEAAFGRGGGRRLGREPYEPRAWIAGHLGLRRRCGAENAQRELFGFDRTREISTKSASEIAEAAKAWGQIDDIA